MKKALFLAAVVLFIAVMAVMAHADEGSIRVDVSKVDKVPEDIVILLLITGMLVVLLIFAIFIAKGMPRKKYNKEVPNEKPKKTKKSKVKKTKVFLPGTKLHVRQNKDDVKDEVYYRDLFKRPTVQIADEKATPAEVSVNSGGIEKYLKEDERIVINVLKMKNNSCSQGTIRVVTDFSKAKLSRILDELEQRGVVHKQRDGRKNIVTLKA